MSLAAELMWFFRNSGEACGSISASSCALGGSSMFIVSQTTGHLSTNAWITGQFGVAKVTIEEGYPCSVRTDREPTPYD